MPELPEVEVVRRGLDTFLAGQTIAEVDLLHERVARRHRGGPVDIASRLNGTRVLHASRRGKYLWLALDSDDAIVLHLGMSGQLLVERSDVPEQTHLRARIRFVDGERELRFVDQRTFGGLAVEMLVPDDRGGRVPVSVAHIARDPLDPCFDADAFVRDIRARRTGIKRALLDQTLASGIGNIYADEALWRARLHFARPTQTLTRPEVRRVLQAAGEVMTHALGQGGTSFDALYVDVDGNSGYFERSLEVYGREDEPCSRCGTPIRRDRFMNRSSFTCPRCQPRPRRGVW